MTDLSIPVLNPALLDQATQLLLAPAALEFHQLSRVLADIHGHRIDYADLYFQYSRVEAWSLEEGIVKSGSFSIDRGVGVRAVSGEKTAFAYSDDISLEALAQAASATKAIARQGQGAVAALERVGNARALYPARDPVMVLTDGAKVALLERLERIARARDPRVTQVIASLAGEYEAIVVVRSDGLIAADVRPLVRLSLNVIVEDNGRREQGMAGGGGRLDYGYFTEALLQDYAAQAVDQALLNVNARAAPAGTMTVVLGPGWPGILLHEAIGHGLEGDFNRKETSAFSNRIGQRVAAPGVTVVDDGTIPDRRGSLNIDDEGNPTQRTVLIEDGILKCYMQDTLNARLMGVPPTGNGRRESFAHIPMPRMTNTVMLNGDRDPVSRRRPVCGQLRRRSGRHHQRQIRVLCGRSVEDREGQARLPSQGRDADRQRPRCAHPCVDDRQRSRARPRCRHLRQGWPERAGRSRPTNLADRRVDRRWNSVGDDVIAERRPGYRSAQPGLHLMQRPGGGNHRGRRRRR